MTLIQAKLEIEKQPQPQPVQDGPVQDEEWVPDERLFAATDALKHQEKDPVLNSRRHEALIVGIVVAVCVALLFCCTLLVYARLPDGAFDKHKSMSLTPSTDKEDMDTIVSNQKEPAMPNAPYPSECYSITEEEGTPDDDDAIALDAKRLQREVEGRMRKLAPQPGNPQSDAFPGPPGEASEEPQQQEILPPVCPSLILSDCEARCALDVKALQAMKRTPGQLDLIGLSGNLLFKTNIQECDEGCMLSVALAHSGSVPRVTVLPPTEEGMEIKGPGGAHYGWIKTTTTEDGLYEVVKDDEPRLVIVGNPADLRLEVKASAGGNVVSKASRSTEYVSEQEHLEFRVQPGFDMVLIVSCVLAALLIAP